MFRPSPWSRLRSALAPQRKLFLLAFLWTCLCMLIFKSILFNTPNGPDGSPSGQSAAESKVHARSADAASSSPQLFESSAPSAMGFGLAPEIDLYDNTNVDRKSFHYSLTDRVMDSSSESRASRHRGGKPLDQTSTSLSSTHTSVDSRQPKQTKPDHNKGALRAQSQRVTTNTSPKQQHHYQSSPGATSGNISNSNNNSRPNLAPQHTNEQPAPIAGAACHYEFPNLFDLQFNNIYWQKLTIKLTRNNEQDDNDDDDDGEDLLPGRKSNNANATPTAATANNTFGPNHTAAEANYYLYNAYYDDRWRGGAPSVRILAMIDRIQPPPTNCLLWSTKLRESSPSTSPSQSTNTPDQVDGSNAGRLVPLVTRAQFVYAWYPKWGNYKDGILQPWIVTCPVPRAHVGLVPDSVSLVEERHEIRKQRDIDFAAEGGDDDDGADDADVVAPAALVADTDGARHQQRDRRDASQESLPASIAMPPSFSSSSPALASANSAGAASASASGSQTTASSYSSSAGLTRPMSMAAAAAADTEYDCEPANPITNNLIVYNHRPQHKQKFAVCVKGLDFPHEDVSVRLVEWIELLNLLGASKIFLYELDVHENISKVLNYYQKRGIVELTPLTLPGDQPNLPEYQHIYLKSKLTAKRQNELIPYNDCLYRNLNSYQYLALLDIDEIIMPLKHHNWYDLMHEVEKTSLSEQNYSRASYNVRNVYFFDDLSGPLGTTSSSSSSSSSSSVPSIDSSDTSDGKDSASDNGYDNKNPYDRAESTVYSLERGIPHYLHMMSHVYRSKNYTEPGQYVKCFHNTERIVSLHNHFPMNCFGQCTTYSIAVSLAHLQHYRKDCVGPLKQSCKRDFRVFTTRDTTIWKYNQPMIKRTTRVLHHLGLLSKRN